MKEIREKIIDIIELWEEEDLPYGIYLSLIQTAKRIVVFPWVRMRDIRRDHIIKMKPLMDHMFKTEIIFDWKLNDAVGSELEISKDEIVQALLTKDLNSIRKKLREKYNAENHFQQPREE